MMHRTPTISENRPPAGGFQAGRGASQGAVSPPVTPAPHQPRFQYSVSKERPPDRPLRHRPTRHTTPGHADSQMNYDEIIARCLAFASRAHTAQTGDSHQFQST